MSLDFSRMGTVVQAQMQAIEEDYPEDTDAEIGLVIVLTEIVTPDGQQMIRRRVSDDAQGVKVLAALIGTASVMLEENL